MKKINDEVYYTHSPLVTIGREQLAFLKEQTGKTLHKRMRICAHTDENDAVHEMIVCLHRDTYIRPHKHLGKGESMHVIEGSAQALFFDEQGAIVKSELMQPPHQDGLFFYKIFTEQYHSLIMNSEFFIFHETLKGPFEPETNCFAPWSPAEADTADVKKYLKTLKEQLS